MGASMTLQGRVQNGVVVLTSGPTPPDGTLVTVVPIDEPAAVSTDWKGPYPVSKEQREALLGLIGLWKLENPPSDEEVERIIEEARMRKYG
jgi:hypothetical protein